jgi:hypothetical protein
VTSGERSACRAGVKGVRNDWRICYRLGDQRHFAVYDGIFDDDC